MVLVALNAGTTAQKIDLQVSPILPDGGTLREEWGQGTKTVVDGYIREITVPPRDGCVWVARP